MEAPWRIWIETFKDGKKIGSGVWHGEYSSKGNATKRAKQLFENPFKSTGDVTYKYIVSQTNPFEE